MNTPLVGRADEFATLRRLQEALTAKAGGYLVLVAGEPGVGKTRLISEAVKDRLLLKVSFPRARFAVPGLGIRMLAQSDTPGADALRQRFEQPDEAPGGQLSIWLEANDLLARAAPCVLVLDDLQWADELTLGWLSQMAELLERIPVLVVCGVRAAGTIPEGIRDALQPLFRVARVEEVLLEPLAVEETALLSGAMGHPTSTDFVSRLHQRTDGIPLAVVEVLRELDRHQGSDALDRLQGVASTSELPLVSAMVRDQLIEAEDQARTLLEVAALMPQPPSQSQIVRALGWEQREFDSVLETVISSGLLQVEGHRGLSFRHELQRQGIQDQLPLSTGREHHRRIAKILTQDSAPSGQIAHHLFEAGAFEQAADRFERAAEEASRVHDHGNALGHLAAALDLADHPDVIVRLADSVVLAARSSGQASDGLRILDPAMARVDGEAGRGRLLLSRARLVAFSGDHDGRMKDLLSAREAFREAGDETGMALALGELALPVGGPLKLRERVALGKKGLELAERSGHPSVIALCAGNLAAAEIMSGDRHAFRLWKRAVEVVEPTPDGTPPEAFRNAINWATGALAYGDYALADRVIRRHMEPLTDPSARVAVATHRALHAWRTGAWDQALAHAAASVNASRPEYAALAKAIELSIEFERETQPIVQDLVKATDRLVELTEEDWGPLALSVLVHVRAERREPRPCRGMPDLIERVLETETLVGWDDVLPVAARVDAQLCRKILLLIGPHLPRGPRADAAMAFTNGLMASRTSDRDPEPLLMEAVERYAALPEPYGEARALEAAAGVRLTHGGKGGQLRVRAAEIYSDLGAQRSLATLLRRGGGSRALARFKVPPSHSHRPAPGLTPREMEVAQLARLGHPARAIAEDLGVSTATVQKHLERIKTKLGVSRKSDLVRLFAEE